MVNIPFGPPEGWKPPLGMRECVSKADLSMMSDMDLVVMANQIKNGDYANDKEFYGYIQEELKKRLGNKE